MPKRRGADGDHRLRCLLRVRDGKPGISRDFSEADSPVPLGETPASTLVVECRKKSACAEALAMRVGAI